MYENNKRMRTERLLPVVLDGPFASRRNENEVSMADLYVPRNAPLSFVLIPETPEKTPEHTNPTTHTSEPT